MDPTYELLGIIQARLRADSGITAIVGSNVYDVPPESAKEPYISIGPSSYQSEDIECAYGGEVTFQIDCWSVRAAQDEIRKMAHAVRKALRADIALTNNALVLLDHWRTDYLQDGTSRHASVRFTAFVEEP